MLRADRVMMLLPLALKRRAVGLRSMSKPRRDLLFAGSGTVASRIAWFVAIPIVARLYSPTDVGAWPLVTAVAAIVAVFGTLRLDVAITIAHYTRRAQTLVFATIALTIILS